MSRLKSFLSQHLGTLLEDPTIQKYFTDEQGKRLDAQNPLYRDRRQKLEEALKASYESHLQSYEKRTFFQKYVATPLRYAALPLYAAGAVTFGLVAFASGAPLVAALPAALYAALGYTGWGVLSSAAADLVDYASYLRRGLISPIKDTAMLAPKTILGKVLGYIPLATGIADLYWGRSKFENRVWSHLEPQIQNSLGYAKRLFLSRIYDTKQPIPLRTLRDPAYAITPIPQVKAA